MATQDKKTIHVMKRWQGLIKILSQAKEQIFMGYRQIYFTNGHGKSVCTFYYVCTCTSMSRADILWDITNVQRLSQVIIFCCELKIQSTSVAMG